MPDRARTAGEAMVELARTAHANRLEAFPGEAAGWEALFAAVAPAARRPATPDTPEQALRRQADEDTHESRRHQLAGILDEDARRAAERAWERVEAEDDA